jgi:hypothetical protein
METFDHAERISAAFFMRVIHFVHDAPNKMRAQPARAYFIKIARPNPIEIQGRAAILQHDFEEIFVALAEDLDALVRIALVCVLDYVGAGFVHSKNYLALLLRRVIEQIAQLAHHRSNDGEEFGVRSNPDCYHRPNI